MKIKLAILEKDQSYLNRIVSVFGTKYADKFQIYSFTDMDVAFSTLETAKIEVEKPFPQEKELNDKLTRLAELNSLLDMDEKGEDATSSPLL